MSTSLQLLLTVLLVGGGIGGYHLLTADRARDAGAEDEVGYLRQIASLEERIQVLEAPKPLLRGAVDTQDLWNQLQRLGERVDALEAEPPPASPTRVAAGVMETTRAERQPPTEGERSVTAEGEPSPLTESEEKRVRQLVDGAMRDRMQGWANRRMDRTLGELGIELTADQREKLNTALGEHMRAVRDTFRQAREDGVPREERASLLAPLNEQLTQKMTEFIPASDAEAIVSAIPSMGRGPGGSGMGGRGPR